MEGWDSTRSLELYGLPLWGEGYFGINAQGNVVVRPGRNGVEIDLFTAVSALTRRGIEAPVLLRFDGIVKDRISRLNSAFSTAIAENDYKGRYRGVFPIKVNQQRHVIEAIRKYGRGVGLGLEVGSKPELIAMLAMQEADDTLLLCNGYKDNDYIELALLGVRLGRRVVIILEQPAEVSLVLDISERLGVEPELGVRMKPRTKGAGHWESSGGDAAKFGLTTSEIMEAVQILEKRGKKHCLKLLHYHVGSQITSISAIQKVLRESTRMYTELATLCPSMCLFDVGGGLAVDYDGSRTNFEASMNYTLEEYARDVVEAIHGACQEAGVSEPDIVTESGRALSAHHSVLVFQVADVAEAPEPSAEVEPPPSDHETLKVLKDLYTDLTVKNCQETFNDLIALNERTLEEFVSGQLNLEERAWAERTHKRLLARIQQVSAGLRYLPEDLEKIGDVLRDTYFCSFSMFQSLPDSWAIDQVFPIMPIHRLNEKPTRRGILADMSCDSDGKIDKFVDLRDVKNYLPLHTVRGPDRYYLGVFLVGAYQEILGDLHNLFGDTNAVHLDVNDEGEVDVVHVVQGDTVGEVLSYVQYHSHDLMEQWRRVTEKALKDSRIDELEAARLQKRFFDAVNSYTYFQVFDWAQNQNGTDSPQANRQPTIE